MAESVVVTAPVLVVAVDAWSQRVAARIAHGSAGLVEVVHDVDGAPAAHLALLVAGDMRPTRQTDAAIHLPIGRDAQAIWVGPAVVPDQGGCVWCWQARRRQHAETSFLTGGPAPAAGNGREARVESPAGDALDSVSLAARAARAVTRRVLAAPEAEAGVVRRFDLDGGPASIAQVIPVTGCDRCDPPTPRPAGWSLRPPAGPSRSRERR